VEGSGSKEEKEDKEGEEREEDEQGDEEEKSEENEEEENGTEASLCIPDFETMEEFHRYIITTRLKGSLLNILL
jgi:hypothetical protein